MRHCLRVIALALLLGTASRLPAEAKTIVITDAACDRMAMIAAVAPRMGWASQDEPTSASCNTIHVTLRGESAFLIRFPLDAIPADQRIVKAELLVPVGQLQTPYPRFFVHRILGDWGPGACWLYRTTRPEKMPWGGAGCGAGGTDRAARPTATVRPDKPGERAVNVTADVELWNSGAAPNEGWVISCEDDTAVRLASPVWTANSWKLRITYEPR